MESQLKQEKEQEAAQDGRQEVVERLPQWLQLTRLLVFNPWKRPTPPQEKEVRFKFFQAKWGTREVSKSKNRSPNTTKPCLLGLLNLPRDSSGRIRWKPLSKRQWMCNQRCNVWRPGRACHVPAVACRSLLRGSSLEMSKTGENRYCNMRFHRFCDPRMSILEVWF